MSRGIKPEYTKRRVNRAGDRFRDGNEDPEDVEIVENWRAAHNHILNSWQATLRGRCKGKDIIFAQRLKRKNTIIDKLKRQPSMQLSRMHDIAGCRLIFESIEELNLYRNSLHKSRMKHKRRKEDETPYPYDYISHPAPSGYRGIHDVYEYCALSGKKKDWDGLLVEIQYRTIYQHAWATAVEVAGSLTGNHSKFDRGAESHKEFFRLTSEIIARAFEQCTSCYAGMDNKELLERFQTLEKSINLFRDLSSLQAINKELPFEKQNLILVFKESDGNEHTVDVMAFESLPQATVKYFALEKNNPNKNDIVLVRAASQESIRNAFRNYFSDARDFVSLISKGLNLLSK